MLVVCTMQAKPFLHEEHFTWLISVAVGDCRILVQKLEKSKARKYQVFSSCMYNVNLVNVEDLTFHKCVLSEQWREQGRHSSEVLKPKLEDSKKRIFQVHTALRKTPF